MQLPLRLQLKASRSYLIFLAGGHILAGVAVCFLPLPQGIRLVLLPLLVLLLVRSWRRCNRGLPALLLRRDGKLELLPVQGEPQLTEVSRESVVWPWLVVLHLRVEGGRLAPLILFRDGLVGGDAHRQLRMWLRWAGDNSD